jgi:hypothetical protein
MPPASPSEARIPDLLERLETVLDCTDESQHEMLAQRREWVVSTSQKLADQETDSQYLELCQEIRSALKGGMGSFDDVYLKPGADCKFDEAELNAAFQAILEDLYSNVVQAVDRGDG